MKKIAYFALAALTLAVSCAKEVEAPVELNTRTTHTVTIRAGFDADTKTAYDALGKFSWVAGDKIGVLVSNGETVKQVTFTTTQSGEFVDFSGEVEEGYTLEGIASYPFTGERDGYVCNDLVYEADHVNDAQEPAPGWRLYGSVKPSATRPLSALPLIGKADPTSPGSYQFTTATGIVKFTVENVPLETMFAYLEIPAEVAGESNLNGWYTLAEDGSLKMENTVDGWLNRYNWNVPQTLNSTMEYYFFVPSGTLPAGTKFELCGQDWGAIASFTMEKDVEVARNVITNIAPVTIDPVTEYSLSDVLGTYEMTVTTGPYSSNNKPGDLVLEASDNQELGNVMMTVFGGVSGKQYGKFNGATITFPKDQIFGENPYSDAAEKPYVAIDFYAGSVVDAVFEVVEPGKIRAINADAMGLRTCTAEDWAEYGGGWPWALCYGSIVATWKVPESWTSLGNGLFIDTIVWQKMDLEPYGPVVIEIFEDTAHPGKYRMTNPYVAAAEFYSLDCQDADEWFYFSFKENGQVSYEWLNTGLVIPFVEEAYRWAMFSGDAIAGYGNEYSYVATWTEDGKPQLVNLGPCYRDGSDPDAALYEVGADHQFGAVLFTFPGGGLLFQQFLSEAQVSVSADQNEDPENPDGQGVAGLVDGDLSTYWHSPWGFIDEHPSPVFGQYIDIALTEVLPGKAAFNYCTRVAKTDGYPETVIIGGSHDGVEFEVLGTFELEHMAAAEIYTNTWIGLPVFDAAGYEYLRFGIAKVMSGEDLRVVATEPDQKFTHLAELSLIVQ